MSTPTARLRAKHTAASIAVTVALASALHPAATTTVTSASPTLQHRTVTVPAVELTASMTTDGSSQQVGVADAYLYTLDQTQLVAQLNQIRSLGVTDLRVVVPWIYIQPTSATAYDWSKMDNVINTAHDMGFSLTASITGNPTWNGTPLVGAPNPATYATFAAAVAQRYGSQISAYEVWNEPNAVTFLAPSDPAAYTAMLKAAYTAIKAVQPDATVIAGVLGAVTTVRGLSLAPQQFLAQMYAAGAQGFFDALSFHPYNYTLPFSAGGGVANSPLEQVQAMYALMVANGDSALKIWATEYGNATTPGGITQTQQAQMLQDFITAWSKLSFAGPAFVYTANDLHSGYLLDENNLGLFTSNGLPKLAAQTLATLISHLASGTLPNYTAPQMPAAQTIWIQAVSLSIAVINQALFIPNILTQVLYNAAPAVLQQAFAAVSAAVSMAAGAALTAATPLAERAIDTVITAGPNIQNTAAAINSAVQNAAQAVGTAAHNTELTVAGAVRALAATVAGPHPAAAVPESLAPQTPTEPAVASQSPVAATAPSTLAVAAQSTAVGNAIPAASAATASIANSPTQPATTAGTPTPDAAPQKLSGPVTHSATSTTATPATSTKTTAQQPTSATTIEPKPTRAGASGRAQTVQTTTTGNLVDREPSSGKALPATTPPAADNHSKAPASQDIATKSATPATGAHRANQHSNAHGTHASPNAPAGK